MNMWTKVLGRRSNMRSCRAEIRAVVVGKNGRVRKRGRWRKANSLIKAFAQGLKIQMSQASEIVKNTGGNDRTVGTNAANLRVNATASVTSWGLVVGTGTTAVSMSDWKLETQVTTGVDHSAVVVEMEYPAGNVARVKISRTFTNNTGASLGITEVGLYANLGGTTYFFCIDRTLYSVTVPVGEAVVITYRISFSV